MIIFLIGTLLLGGVVALFAFRSAPEGLEDAGGFRPSRAPFPGTTGRRKGRAGK